MRHYRSIAMALLLAVPLGMAAAPAARAVPITLFDTGVDASGVRQANGTTETHYALVSAPTGVTTTLRAVTSSNGPPVPPWVADDTVSAWIGPSTDQILTGPGGTYDYRTTFSLAGLLPSSAIITGRWAADDSGLDILVNGVSTGDTASGPKAFSGFSLTSGFVDGLNTLDFIVSNKSSSTGLRVEMTGTAAVPEPASLVLLGLGVAGVLLLRRSATGAGRAAPSGPPP